MGVAAILVRRHRAVGVRLANGTEIEASAGVIAGTGAPQLYLDLLERGHLPRRTLADLDRFQYDNSTVKVDWALREPIPWTVHAAAQRVGGLSAVDDLPGVSAAPSGPRCRPARSAMR